MATKKDLIEAQAFSRRRLLTAFTSGAPGGKELEPAKPLRAVIAGIALAVMVVVGGVFSSMLNTPLKEGWQNNTVILVEGSGARYVAIQGTLYPIINATSARLLIPAAEYSVITASASDIESLPIGAAIGILGAPDDTPLADALVSDGWTACPTAEGTALSIPGDALPAPAPTAALVRSDDRTYVITAGIAYPVDADHTDAVLRAVGLSGINPSDVDSKWLNLFGRGTPLAPLDVAGADQVVEGTELTAGTAVHRLNSEDNYVVTADGELAQLTPLAMQLYFLGTGAGRGVLDVSSAELSDLPGAELPAGGGDWPVELLTPVAPGASVCAVLGHDVLGLPTTSLASTMTPPTGNRPIVDPGAGALVAAGGEGRQSALEVYVVDQTGTSFAVPDWSDDILSRLRYTSADVTTVTTAWMQFFAAGPELAVDDARKTPKGADVPTLGSAQSSPSSSAVPFPVSPEPTDGAVSTPSAAAVDAAGESQCKPGEVKYSADPPATFGSLQADNLRLVATGKGVVVAVVDSGIDVSGPHLTNAVIGGVNLVNDGERADGMSDLWGHGTAIAAVIAGDEVPESKMVGLAPDAQLLSVRVYRGDDEQTIEAGFGPDVVLMAEGIRWAVDNGATIINVSMSADDDAPELLDAVEYANANGVLVVASAGNRNTAENQRDALKYPAAFPGVLAVSAVNMEGDVTEASIHGTHVDVAAPGQNVLAVQAGAGDCVFSADVESSSFATAYASAAAASVAQAHPEETTEQWSYRLMATAIRFDPGARDDNAGWGVIQPLDAINYVPGSGERGPDSPFVNAAPVVIAAPTAVVEPRTITSPFVATKDLATAIAALAVGAMATLGVLATYRRRVTASVAKVALAADARPPRPGLLDAAKSDLTRLR